MNNVLDTIKRHWEIEDTIPITLVLGALKATESSKIWLRTLGRGGGEGKSTFFEAISTIPQCSAITADYFTPASLRGGLLEGGSLEAFMKGKTLLLIPESSAFDTMRADKRTEIAGLLRSVYYGDITAVYGSDAGVVKKSFPFSLFIAGNRSSLGRDSILEAQLGQRWVDVDWHLTNKKSKGMSEEEKAIFKEELAESIGAMLQQSTDVEDVRVDINELCSQVAALRGFIPRDAEHNIIGEAVIENTSRLITTFTSIGKGIASIRRRSWVGKSTYKHLLPLAVSCIPEKRVRILRVLLKQLGIKDGELAKNVGVGRQTARREKEDINRLLTAGGVTLKDLVSSGLAEAIKKNPDVAWWQQCYVVRGREIPKEYVLSDKEIVFA
jgi:hypothetical protein